MTNEKFWVVWQPDSGNPTHRHASREDALKEAERLAECAWPRTFYVLEAISSSRKVTVQTTTLVEFDHDELPF